MKRKIVSVKNPGLREKSKKVNKIDKKITSLIKDLKDTILAQQDPQGVGLAAPQIGKNLRVFVMRYQDGLKVFVNPKVLSSRKSTKKEKNVKKIMEGCLSLPHYYGSLTRPFSVKVKYMNEQGKEITETFKGINAQIIQHEIDHLDGTLFIDRLLTSKKPLYELADGDWQKVNLPY